MGAWLTEEIATGRTIEEAYGRALRNATEENGHQEGYSGAINSKDFGYSLVELPARFTYAKLIDLLHEVEENGWELESARDDAKAWKPGGFWNPTGTKRGWKGNLRKAEARLAKAKKQRERLLAKAPSTVYDLDGLARTFNNKWGCPLAVELKGAEAKATYAYRNRRRGEKVFVFFGYAPS